MTRPATAALVAVLLALVAVGVPAGGATGNAGDAAKSSSIDHQINYTVTQGGESDNSPGAKGTDRYLFQSDYGADFEPLGNITFVAPAGQGSTCTTTDARAAGIDRGNDDPGTTTDESLIGRYKEQTNRTNSRGQNVTNFDFYDEGAFAGESIALYKEDQGVLALDGCFRNPETPGWYRGYVYVNGTGPNGDLKEVAGFSAWDYVCECASYDEAVETLGEPPAEGPKGDTMPGIDDGPWYLEETSKDDGAGSGTPTGSESTATSGGGSTTATATSGGDSAAATSTAGGSGSTATPVTGGDESTATLASRRGADATSTSAATGTAASTAGASSGSATTVTATHTGQPGLGAPAALVALAVALVALVGRRR